jgi:pyrroloquinoline quinone biosynthesis protein B
MGTAAGGGFPQWNCWCPCCSSARVDPQAAWPRTQSSVAVSRDGSTWFLLNASPDVRDQLARLPSFAAHDGLRHVPVEGVVLTDAEIDHSLGIVLLREGRFLPLYTTAATYEVLDRHSHVLPVTRAFANVPWTELPLDGPIALRDRRGVESGLTVEAFAVPAGPPLFADTAGTGHTVGLLVRQQGSSASCAFVPACGDLPADLLERLAGVDVLLFDGTFWSDDEIVALGIGSRTARQMDHLPVGGSDGSLERLSSLRGRHRVFTHINNTNPMLLEGSPQRAAVAAAGWTVGYDGLHITI